MQAYLPIFNLILAYSGVILQAVCVIVILLLIFSKENRLLAFIKKHFLFIGFLLTLAGVGASLFYSDVIGFAACHLCWLQRIALYPSCLLFLLAYIKKDRSVSYYIFWLSVFGTLVSLYHNFGYYFGEASSLPCDASGVSCYQRLVSEFGGYISIPSLALTSFVAVFTLLAVAYFYKRETVIK